MFDSLAIPTPFRIGPINAYLAGRTLVDPGPDSEEAWAALVDALGSRELVPDDVEQVLITHPHPDHFGNARRLHDRGARVLASPAAADVVEAFADRLAYEQSYFTPLLERWGVSRDTVETTMQLPEAFLPYVEDVAVDHTLAAGDAVAVDDRRLHVDALRGHAVGEVLFAYPDRAAGDGAGPTGARSGEGRRPGEGVESGERADPGESGEDDAARAAVVGDHVLPDTTATPFLRPPGEPDGERPHVLPRYNESLAALRSDGYARLLPGHGDPVLDPAARIDAVLAAHEERTANVRGLLDGPTTPAGVMYGVFGDLPATELFAAMSEAVGHLDVLEERGEVDRRQHGGVVVYELVEE